MLNDGDWHEKSFCHGQMARRKWKKTLLNEPGFLKDEHPQRGVAKKLWAHSGAGRKSRLVFKSDLSGGSPRWALDHDMCCSW